MVAQTANTASPSRARGSIGRWRGIFSVGVLRLWPYKEKQNLPDLVLQVQHQSNGAWFTGSGMQDSSKHQHLRAFLPAIDHDIGLAFAQWGFWGIAKIGFFSPTLHG